MKTTWLDAKCPKCGYVWNVRAPKLMDLSEAVKEGRILCLKCGETVNIDIPPYQDFVDEGLGLPGDEKLFGRATADVVPLHRKGKTKVIRKRGRKS